MSDMRICQQLSRYGLIRGRNATDFANEEDDRKMPIEARQE
jgi:hypothetical protein